MIAITREQQTGKVVLTTHGALDDAAVHSLTEEEAPIVLDLADAGELKSAHEMGLLSAIAFRAGPVRVRGARRHHRNIVAAAKASA